MPKKSTQKHTRKRVIHQDGTESDLERKFKAAWLQYYPEWAPLTQFQFHPIRKWQFDFAWPLTKVAVEIQGMGPAHCSHQGMTADYDKHRAAVLMNWKVLYFTSTHLSPRRTEEICQDVARLLKIYQPNRSVSYTPMHLRK